MARHDEEKAFDREIGARIRQARRLRGLSQSDLGRLLGVTFQQVQKYERGTNRVPLSRLVGIAAAFETRLDEFLPICAPTATTRHEVDVLLLAQKVAALPTSLRDAVERLVGGLSGGEGYCLRAGDGPSMTIFWTLRMRS